jgi:hypothetical protein
MAVASYPQGPSRNGLFPLRSSTPDLVEPTLSLNDESYECSRHVEGGGECRVTIPKKRPSSNVANVIPRQLGARIGLASNRVLFTRQSLGNEVLLVFEVCSQEQMPRIHAWRIVTGVADEQALRNGAIRQLPGNTRGPVLATFGVHHPVAIVVSVSRPLPARFGWGVWHEPLEALSARSQPRLVVASLRAIQPTTLTCIRRVRMKREPAYKARDVRISAHRGSTSVVLAPGRDSGPGAFSSQIVSH